MEAFSVQSILQEQSLEKAELLWVKPVVPAPGHHPTLIQGYFGVDLMPRILGIESKAKTVTY